MEASVSKERKHAFVLKQSDLKKIWDLLETRIGPVAAEVSCADGIDREFSDWKQLTAFDNPPQKQIVSLSLDARADNWSKSAHLHFSKSSWGSIELRIRGTEQVVSRLYDDINDIIDGICPWYSKLASFEFFYIISSICSIAFILCMFAFLNKHTKAGEDLLREKPILVVIISPCVIAILVIFIWLFTKLRERFFPLATFALGQGEQRYHLDEKIRWTIIIGFVVSLAASLIAAFI